MVDIDWFKQLNDTYGHQHGDEYLIAVVGILQNSVRRATDAVARYGGEVFTLLLPDTDSAGAMLVAETIRTRVEDLRIKKNALNPWITISAGVVTVVPSSTELPTKLVMMADQALCKAKHAGRNRLYCVQS